MFTICQGLGKGSASKTDIYIAKKNGRTYIIKLFIDKMVESNGFKKTVGQEYKHEESIYRTLTKQLVDNPLLQIRTIVPLVETVHYTFSELYEKLCRDLVTPHLSKDQILRNLVANTLFMMSYSPTRQKINNDKTIKKPLEADYRKKLRAFSLSSGSYNLLDTEYMGIVTPKMGNGDSFSVFFQNHITTVKDFMDYLFLILTTLRAMSEIGFNQNDLHWGNILMDSHYPLSPQTRHFLFSYQGTLLWIDKPYTPFIYDFDRASIRNEHIKFLQGVKHGGNCPTFHSKRDLLKTLCCAYHACDHKSKSYPAFSALSNYILQTLITSKTIRSIIQRTNPSCWMETLTGKKSILCNDRELDHGLQSWDTCLRWILSQTSYHQFNFSVSLFRPLRVPVALSKSDCKSLFSFVQKIHHYLESQHPTLSVSQFLIHNFQFLGTEHDLLKDEKHHKPILSLLLYNSLLELKHSSKR